MVSKISHMAFTKMNLEASIQLLCLSYNHMTFALEMPPVDAIDAFL